MNPADELSIIDELLNLDGIDRITIDVTIEPTVEMQLTGERDESFQSIRERIISEDELNSYFLDTPWRYFGTIDTLGDFYVRDRLSFRTTVDSEQHSQ